MHKKVSDPYESTKIGNVRYCLYKVFEKGQQLAQSRAGDQKGWFSLLLHCDDLLSQFTLSEKNYSLE